VDRARKVCGLQRTLGARGYTNSVAKLPPTSARQLRARLMTPTATIGTDELASSAVTFVPMHAEREEKWIALLQRVPTRKIGVRAGTVVVMPMTRRHDHPTKDALIHPESNGRNAITCKDYKRKRTRTRGHRQYTQMTSLSTIGHDVQRQQLSVLQRALLEPHENRQTSEHHHQ